MYKRQTLKGSSKYDDAALAEKLTALDIFSDDYIENPEDAHIEIKDGDVYKRQDQVPAHIHARQV